MDFKRTSLSFFCASLIFTCTSFTVAPSVIKHKDKSTAKTSKTIATKSDKKTRKSAYRLIIAPTNSSFSTSSSSFGSSASLDCFQTPFDSELGRIIISPSIFYSAKDSVSEVAPTAIAFENTKEENIDILALLDEEATQKTTQDDLELDTEQLDNADFTISNNLAISPQLLQKVAIRENFVTSLVDLAAGFEGVPYVSGGKSPKGFDCSGFVSYIYSRFKVNLPASSISYDNVGQRVNLEDAQVGDVICFTGRNSRSGRTGHVGIIVENNPNEPIKFIHAASGSRRQITYSTMESAYYKTRFRSVRRISVPVLQEMEK